MPTPAPGRIERTLAAILSFRIRRRVFLALLGATGWAAMSQAREAGKPSRIGILTNRRDDDNWKRFVAGLKDDGYVEGQNLMIDWRYSEGQVERWPALASELVGLNVDVIVVTTTPAALAAKKVTSTVPIVITAAFDLSALGSRTASHGRAGTLPDWVCSSLKSARRLWRCSRRPFRTPRA